MIEGLVRYSATLRISRTKQSASISMKSENMSPKPEIKFGTKAICRFAFQPYVLPNHWGY